MNTAVRGGGGGGGGHEAAAPAAGAGYANRVFTALSLASLYILLKRPRRRGDEQFFTPAEIAAAAALAASLVWLYLIPFFLGSGVARRDRLRQYDD